MGQRLKDWVEKNRLTIFWVVGPTVLALFFILLVDAASSEPKDCPECQPKDCPECQTCPVVVFEKIVTGETEVVEVPKVAKSKRARRGDDPAFSKGTCIHAEEWGPIRKITRVGHESYITKVVKEATDGDDPYRIGNLQDKYFSLTDNSFVEVECP